MKNKIPWLFVALGITLALFGIGIDYLLPGTSPGVNLPQFVVILTGLAISFGSWQLRRPEVRRRFSSSTGKTIGIALSITLTTLLVLDIVLTVWGMPTYFPSAIPDPDVSVSDWRICDELGCRYKYDGVIAACADGVITGRRCVINRQGFSDTDDFVVHDDFAGRIRIMTLGDSFTQGFSAEVGKSFVETIETLLPEVILWNTAISGNGTNRALATFQAFASQLKPQLTILGFYMNDVSDNLKTHDNWIQLEDANGSRHLVRQYHADRWGNEVAVPPEIAYRLCVQRLQSSG